MGSDKCLHKLRMTDLTMCMWESTLYKAYIRRVPKCNLENGITSFHKGDLDTVG